MVNLNAQLLLLSRRGTPIATTWFYLPAFTLPDFENLFNLINDKFENDVIATIIFEFMNFAWILPKLGNSLNRMWLAQTAFDIEI